MSKETDKLYSSAVKTKRYYKSLGTKVPSFIDSIIKGGIDDINKLTFDKQEILRSRDEPNDVQYPAYKFNPEGLGYDSVIGDELKKLYPLTTSKPDEYIGDYINNDNSHQSWVWHEDEKDYFLHNASRDPRTGQILKGRKHETYYKTIKGEKDAGYEITKGEDGKYYSNMQQPLEQSLVPDPLKNRFVMGGKLQGTDVLDNYLNEYNNGGSHESNPHGGIPQGIGNNGKMNTVEEDETSINIDGTKYIFSRRLKL